MINRAKTFMLSIIAISIISLFSINSVKAQGNVQVSLDMFYDELSPYGYWDNDRNYGDIWYPQAEKNFRPYSSNGYWTMTQYGNTWVSDYAWGWAPFHYGRWVNTPHRGWGWVPGYEWGPAWVDWRSGNGYYGWAPMTPRIGINISLGLPINFWIFAPSRRIYDRDIYRHSNYGRPNIYNNTTIINNTYIVNNNHYYGGPSRRDIERTTGRRVIVRDVRNADRPGSSRVDNRSVSIYRPENNARNQSTDRTVRPTSRPNNNGMNNSGNVRNDNNNSREMYIGKDGNAIIRDRTDNRMNNSQGRNTNTAANGTINRTERNNSRPQNTNTNTNTGRSTIENKGTIRNESAKPSTPSVQERQDVQRSRHEAAPQRERQRINNTTVPVQQASRSTGTETSNISRSNNQSAVQANRSRSSQTSGSSRMNTSRVERSSGTVQANRSSSSNPTRNSSERPISRGDR